MVLSNFIFVRAKAICFHRERTETQQLKSQWTGTNIQLKKLATTNKKDNKEAPKYFCFKTVINSEVKSFRLIQVKLYWDFESKPQQQNLLDI